MLIKTCRDFYDEYCLDNYKQKGMIVLFNKCEPIKCKRDD
jgi:hypothetical protein